MRWKHPNDMDRDELRDVVSDLSWMALDLAQHLNFMNLQFSEGGRKGPDDDDAEGYTAAEQMAYAISNYPYHGPPPDMPEASNVSIAMFDGKGGWSARLR